MMQFDKSDLSHKIGARVEGDGLSRRRTKSPVSGLKRVRSGGKVYWYHRATGRALKNDPNTAAGLLEIATLDDGAAPSTESDEGGASLAQIISAYRHADAGSARRMLPFVKLDALTQAEYQACFDRIEPVADMLFPDSMKPRHVQKLVDDAAEKYGWAFGDKLRRVLRDLMDWGAYHELTSFDAHPCAGVLPPPRTDRR